MTHWFRTKRPALIGTIAHICVYAFFNRPCLPQMYREEVIKQIALTQLLKTDM